MKPEHTPLKRYIRPKVTSLAVPMKPIVSRAAVTVLLGLSLALVIFSHSNNDMVRSVRSGVMDVVVPLLDIVSQPSKAVHDMSTWFGDMVTLREENLALKAENARLMQWQSTAKKLDVENQAMRKLLNFSAATVPSFVSAHIVGDGSGPYTRSALISAGEIQGVKNDQAVVSEKGLVGRVVQTGHLSSQVLLLTDINSRVPVMSEQSRERFILAGDNTATLKLMYVPDNSKLAAGERLVTSGDGGVFPAGIPVGVLAGKEGGEATVQPYADWSHLEYISVVDYEFAAKQ